MSQSHVYRLTLPYPVSANRYWVAIRIPGRTMMAPSKEAKAYKQQVGWLARQAGIREPLKGWIYLRVVLYPERPLDWQRRARCNPATWDDTVRCIDLGNAEKVLSDALNGIAWGDDKQLRRILLEREEPDGVARVEVTIAQMTAQSAQADLLGAAA
jgi:crossover junction endodeoxyribonuclease RusA